MTIAEVDHWSQLPISASHLAPPQSAISLFDTESDPATPWDPAIRRKKVIEAAQAEAFKEYSDVVFGVPPAFASPIDYPAPVYAPMYPWGMPMSPAPLPGYDAVMPVTPGGLGVMWTPAGWAIQDAAMKHSQRAAESRTLHGAASKRKPKGYYKSKHLLDAAQLNSVPARFCGFFAEGNCPHGDACT